MEVENSILHSEATVFSTILTEVGEKEMRNSKNQVEAVRTESRDTCIKDNWNGMIQMMAFATAKPFCICCGFKKADMPAKKFKTENLQPAKKKSCKGDI